MDVSVKRRWSSTRIYGATSQQMARFFFQVLLHGDTWACVWGRVGLRNWNWLPSRVEAGVFWIESSGVDTSKKIRLVLNECSCIGPRSLFTRVMGEVPSKNLIVSTVRTRPRHTSCSQHDGRKVHYKIWIPKYFENKEYRLSDDGVTVDFNKWRQITTVLTEDGSELST